MLDASAGNAGRTAPRRAGFLLALAALLVLVAGVALAARWRWAAVPDGRQLRPRPDALEYAAAAQAIAAEGRYLLQVGPYRVRPRYPPGWPMVLAGAVRLGVPGEELWRVSGLFGAGLACLLALAAAGAVRRLGAAREGEGPAAAAGALAAGALAGMGWALAPLAAAVGRVALADEAAAFVAALSTIATCLACIGPAPGRSEPKEPEPGASEAGDRFMAAPGSRSAAGSGGRLAAEVSPGRLAAALGGLAFGLLAGIRPASAALFAPAVLVFAVYAWRARGVPGMGGRAAGPRRGRRRELWRRAALWAAGAAVAPLLIVILLWRSGLAPWHWSGYAFWAPRWYADAGATFNIRYALRGNDDFARGGNDRPIPNLRFYAQVLLGLPGLEPASYLGLYWPAAGLLAGWLALWRRRRRHPSAAAALLASAALLGTHLVFYSLYFFPAPRFLLAPLALPLLGAGVACGLGIASSAPGPAPAQAPALAAPRRPRRWTRPAACLAAAALAGAILAGFLAFRAQAPAALYPDRDVRAAFAAWRRLPEEERARGQVPFDPLEAQALGLLPPSVTRRIRAWGELPPTVHVKRLRALGVIFP
jgi:hypothetical protein